MSEEAKTSGKGFGGTVKARKAPPSLTKTGSSKPGAAGDTPDLLVPVHAFGAVGGGAANDLRDPVSYLSDSTSVCHLVGQHLAVYSTDKRSMAFFNKNKGSLGVLGMCVAPNWKVVALCEACAAEDKAQVSVYHVTTQRKMRTLTFPMRGDFTLCAFSADAKILVTAGVGPDGETQIVYWKWAVEKVMSCAKGAFRVTRLRVNPDDGLLITTSGPQHLRLWRYTLDPVLKESSLVPGKREQDNFVDHVWLKDYSGRAAADGQSDTRLLAATDSGMLLVFEKVVGDDGAALFEVRHTVQCTLPDPSLGVQVRIESLVASRKGFCVGGTRGFLAVYETTGDPKDPFLMLKTFVGGEDSITSMSVSPNEEHLIAFSRPSRLRVFPLSSTYILGDTGDHFKPLVPRGVHTDTVCGMDICVQMPLLVTVSQDKSVRVWDYLSWNCQLSHVLDEVPQTVAFHPSGLLILVGFRDRLRAYNLLMDGLKLFQPSQKDLQVKNCRAISFAHGGQFFACGAGIKVQVYATYTFEEVASFEGHVSVPIRQLTWSNDDSLLCSCGDDGAVYTCSLDSGARLEELSFVHKQTQYSTVAITGDKQCVVAAGADGFLRMTSCTGEEEEVSCGDGVVTQLLLDKDNKRMFAGTNTGTVRVYKWPLVARPGDGESKTKPQPGGGGGAPPNDGAGAGVGAGAGAALATDGAGGPVVAPFAEYRMHAAAITSVRLSRDGKYLFTASADGCVFANALPAPASEDAADTGKGKRGKASKRRAAASTSFEPPDKRQFNLGVALVNQEVMEEKLADLAAMEKNLEETKSTAKYNLILKDSEWAEKMAKQAEAMDEALAEERARYEQLQQRHEAYVRDHMEEKERTDAEHVRVVQEVENQYEHKLALELERYDALSEQVESMRQECEILLDSAEAAHTAALRDKEEAAAAREAELQRQLDALHENVETNKRKFKTILEEVELEHEQEIASRKTREREKIAEVQKNTASKEKELTHLNSRNDQMFKKVSELSSQKEVLDKRLEEAEARSRRLDELLAHADRVIVEQKKSIADKEKQILNLRAGNRTLDNFRFVLDHRINQLTQERGPITAHVDELERHIHQMYEELVQEFQEKKTTDREMSNKDLKIEGLTREAAKLRASVREKERVIASIQADLERHVKTTEVKDLEGALKDMYRIYVKHERPGYRSSKSSTAVAGGSGGSTDGDGRGDGDAAINPVQASEAVQEVLRQKEYMERHAKGLKRKLNIRMSQTKAAARARLAENSTLINECNQLRKDNVRFKRKIKELETNVYLLTRDNGGLPDSGSVAGSTAGSTGGRGSRGASRRGTAPRRGMNQSMSSSVTSLGQRSAARGATAPSSDDPGNEAMLKMLGGNGMSQSASAAQLGRSANKRRGGLRSSSSAVETGGGGGPGSYGLWASRPSSGGGSRGLSSSGRIVRGTTKQLDELSNVRVKMGELLSQLDDNNREMSMQRREIKRLREQVRMLATRGAPPGPGMGPGLPRPVLYGAGDAGSGVPVSPVGTPRGGSLAPLQVPSASGSQDAGAAVEGDDEQQPGQARPPLASAPADGAVRDNSDRTGGAGGAGGHGPTGPQ